MGCSGAVFGFMGLYVADMLLNFRSLSFPWLRLIWIAATLAYFVVASITQVSSLWAAKSTHTMSMQYLHDSAWQTLVKLPHWSDLLCSSTISDCCCESRYHEPSVCWAMLKLRTHNELYGTQTDGGYGRAWQMLSCNTDWGAVDDGRLFRKH